MQFPDSPFCGQVEHYFRMARYTTMLGMLPLQIDYSASVQDNITVDSARFAKPAAALAPGQ